MAETCGGVGFCSNRFAPTKKPDLNPMTLMNKWAERRQDAKIDKLVDKGLKEGLSVKEKIDLAASSIDRALRNGDYLPTVMYNA